VPCPKSALYLALFDLRMSGDELLYNSFCATIYSCITFTYLESQNDRSLYIGFSADLKTRLKKHYEAKVQVRQKIKKSGN